MDYLRPGKPGAVAGEGILPDVPGEARWSGPRFLHAGNIRQRKGVVVRGVRGVRENSGER